MGFHLLTSQIGHFWRIFCFEVAWLSRDNFGTNRQHATVFLTKIKSFTWHYNEHEAVKHLSWSSGTAQHSKPLAGID